MAGKCESFAGQARHRITIQKKVLTADSYGGQSNTWTDVGDYWAMIKPVSGYERFRSERLESVVTHKITIRYQSVLKDTQTVGAYRIQYDGRVFSVRYVQNLDRDMKNEGRDFQLFYAEEGVADND